MCLRSAKKICIAKSDLVVYKMLAIDKGRNVVTPYRLLKLAKNIDELAGVEMNSELIQFKDSYYSGAACRMYQTTKVEYGIHTFRDFVDARDESTRFYRTHWCEFSGMILVECIIPKGSKYCKGTWGTDNKASLASEKLIIKKVLI